MARLGPMSAGSNKGVSQMVHQKPQHVSPKKTQWRAWHRIDLERQASGPDLPETEQIENKQQKASSQSVPFQQWLDAGGQPDKASLYHIEIFARTV